MYEVIMIMLAFLTLIVSLLTLVVKMLLIIIDKNAKKIATSLSAKCFLIYAVFISEETRFSD
ncbi:putative holin-like toxin [uncultured Catenibacterium sp.]|uniref:putative holin-like toxin n=1 Tax=uncultured Catenibacterium sp. TaxID=286142 RepID=UPI0025E814D8|nr:putative holin-like toxin [uncultured Catenibacterium sp.]